MLRAVALTLVMLVTGVGAALAHALPGSVLELRQEGADMTLTVRFPLEDLLIAAPELTGLETIAAGAPLSQQMRLVFAQYLGRHMALGAQGASLALELSDVQVQSAYHEHLGDFRLVVSNWRVSGAKVGLDRFDLTYDAVMHEVRNHRAVVEWLDAAGVAHFVTEFGYFQTDASITLDLSRRAQE